MDPINYAVDVQSPVDQFMKGYGGAAAIRDDQLKQQQQQLAIQQQQQYQKDVQAAMVNPTPQAFTALQLKYPQQHEAMGKAWDRLSTDQQQVELRDSTQLAAALHAGRPDVAQSLLQNRIQAAKNSGQPTDVFQMLHDTITADPQKAYASVMHVISGIPGGEKVLSGLGTAGQEGRAQDKAPAELRTANADATVKEAAAAVAPQAEQQKLQTGIWNNANLKSQIEERAARLGLDRDRLTTETQTKLTELNQKFGELPESAAKLVNDGVLTANTSEQQVSQYQKLAGQIDALGGSWGAGSTAHEWLKRTTGSEDAVSAIKREYTRMASQGVIKLLPPGPASDKDIANAKEGIPNANAAPEVMASYLRGMAKLSAYDAVFNNAKAEWAGQVRSLNNAPRDITIDGTKVPAGTTFNDFARQYLAKKADAMTSAATVTTRGYMRFATPAAPAGAVQPGQMGSGTFGVQ